MQLAAEDVKQLKNVKTEDLQEHARELTPLISEPVVKLYDLQKKHPMLKRYYETMQIPSGISSPENAHLETGYRALADGTTFNETLTDWNNILLCSQK